ncbi:class I SAM-dependent methyltransferase [Cryobacterium sp. BB736]|uniref:class I SAM-dependent methyltransferase n=1 Tax=Cryobacterium sp. BB736 TaxID=2746963 RepID=UPI001875E382
MSFDTVAADAYDRFMGRYSRLLSPQLADFAGVAAGQRALDVGCGTGALTAELSARLGEDAVAAIDPAPRFVEATQQRHPGAKVVQARAEDLPFGDDAFDVALAQLVVHFMRNPVVGLSEMRRVTRQGGVVAACVWDFTGGRSPLSLFWRVAGETDPGLFDESERAGTSEGDLERLFGAAGFADIVGSALEVSMEHAGFDEWWQPYTAGVGPAGEYLARADADRRDHIRERCRAELPDGPFTVTAVAWAARGTVPA